MVCFGEDQRSWAERHEAFPRIGASGGFTAHYFTAPWSLVSWDIRGAARETLQYNQYRFSGSPLSNSAIRIQLSSSVMPKRRTVESLYYIAPLENLPSILERGILSHAEVERQGLHPFAIYDADIVKARRERKAPDGRSLWEFANLYFQPRNPMMYRVVNERGTKNLVILALRPCACKGCQPDFGSL